MKIIKPILLSLSLTLFSHADQPSEVEAIKSEEVAPLRHVVMFKFKEETSKEKIKEIEKAFGELPKKIKTITGYEWGTNISEENKNEGFTHCFIVTFKDQTGLDVYGPHEDHQAFVKILRPSLDKVLVLDFIAQ